MHTVAYIFGLFEPTSIQKDGCFKGTVPTEISSLFFFFFFFFSLFFFKVLFRSYLLWGFLNRRMPQISCAVDHFFLSIVVFDISEL